jgi:hypothetical protein
MPVHKIHREILDRMEAAQLDAYRTDYQHHLEILAQLFDVEPSKLHSIPRAAELAGCEELWIREKLKEWKKQNLLGRHKDDTQVILQYRCVFMKFVIKLAPGVIHELREFVSLFAQIFNEPKSVDFDDFLLEMKTKLAVIGVSAGLDRPGVEANPDGEWYWGLYRTMFEVVLSESSESSDLNLDQARLASFDSEYRGNIVAAFNTGAGRVVDSLGLRGGNTIKSFAILQYKLICWCRKHNLKKDWILQYAYSFLAQFRDDPELEIEALVISDYPVSAGTDNPPTFQVPGWRIGEESGADFVSRSVELFKDQLAGYMIETADALELNSKKRITKPIDYHRVKWRVQSTVLGMNDGDILQDLTDEYDSPDLSTIRKAFKVFDDCGLP